jgi:hypothetical protein
VVNFALTYHQDRIGRRRAALTTESAGQAVPDESRPPPPPRGRLPCLPQLRKPPLFRKLMIRG